MDELDDAHRIHWRVGFDDIVNQMVVRAVLENLGHSCDVVGSGDEVVAQVQVGGYDLVLMDIQMPVLDGLSATRLVRTWPGFERLPIVAMTAHVLAHEKRISSDAGMSDHVCKPFDANDF